MSMGSANNRDPTIGKRQRKLKKEGHNLMDTQQRTGRILDISLHFFFSGLESAREDRGFFIS